MEGRGKGEKRKENWKNPVETEEKRRWISLA